MAMIYILTNTSMDGTMANYNTSDKMFALKDYIACVKSETSVTNDKLFKHLITNEEWFVEQLGSCDDVPYRAFVVLLDSLNYLYKSDSVYVLAGHLAGCIRECTKHFLPSFKYNPIMVISHGDGCKDLCTFSKSISSCQDMFDY